MSFLPNGIITQFLVPNPKSVRFLIGFIHHIEAIDVAQFIKQGVVRVMAGAYHIDVRLFHQFHIAHHGLPVHMLAGPRMLLVAVHAFELYGLSVDCEQVAMHLNRTHTKPPVNGLNNFVLVVLQVQAKIVQVGSFGRPKKRVAQMSFQLHVIDRRGFHHIYSFRQIIRDDAARRRIACYPGFQCHVGQPRLRAVFNVGLYSHKRIRLVIAGISTYREILNK